MFGKWFGKVPKEGSGQNESVKALYALDAAIMEVHPERFPDPLDAAMVVNSVLVNVNTLLGRDDTERFFPIDYDAVVQRIDFYAKRNLLGQILQVSKTVPVVDALLQGTLHEYKIRHHKMRHDAANLGKEVQSSTLTLIDFLNRCAKTRPEPMPKR